MLVEVVLPIAKSSDAPEASQRQAINCLGNMCVKTGTRLSTYHEEMFRAMQVIVTRTAEGPMTGYPLLAAALRAMHYMILEAKTVHISHMSQLVPLLRELMMCGANMQQQQQPPAIQAPAPARGMLMF